MTPGQNAAAVLVLAALTLWRVVVGVRKEWA